MADHEYTAPADFGEYWDGVLAELAATPAAPEIEPIPMRETDFATLYGVRLTSVGPYRLFGYLSVPKSGDAPFPAIYWPPKYASVLEIIPQGTANAVRSQFVTFSLAGRGQRNSDKPFAAMFPGLLTEGVESPDTYVFRGIVADAMRGLEFLESREDVDASRLVAVGNDVAMQSVALRGVAARLVCAPALFFDSLRLASRTTAYPLEEFNDYLRSNPSAADSVARTLSYFDLRAFAPSLEARTLIMAGPLGSDLSPIELRPLDTALYVPGRAHTYIYGSERSSYLDGKFAEAIIANGGGFRQPILPEIWR